MHTAMKHTLLFLSLFAVMQLAAQDYHFSLFDANPFYVNPGLLGERLGDNTGVQAHALYRDQMANFKRFPGSYRSMAVGADEPMDAKFSLGQYIYANRSASSSFATNGFMIAASYRLIDQQAEGARRHNLSFGLQMGIINKTIFPEKFTYDVQYSVYSGDGFDRSIASGETFARQSYFDLNVNFGAYYRFSTRNRKLCAYGGFAMYNITRPNEALLDNGGFSDLPLRVVLHAGAIFVASPLVRVQPLLLYMNQAGAHEFNVGTLIYYRVERTPYEPLYGLSLRNGDAIVFQLGMRYQEITVKAGYDIITSYLKSFRNKGAEFSLVWTFKKKTRAAEPAPVAEPAPAAQP